jgi:hypothetical protein
MHSKEHYVKLKGTKDARSTECLKVKKTRQVEHQFLPGGGPVRAGRGGNVGGSRQLH